jgi:hypothetical protein
MLSRDMCGAHYQRWRTTGRVQADVPIQVFGHYSKACVVMLPGGELCGRPSFRRDRCHAHYMRERATGHVKANVPIKTLNPSKTAAEAAGG